MRLPGPCKASIALCLSAQAVAATDYIFADPFQAIACDGTGCTYCDPSSTGTTPECGSDAMCVFDNFTTSVGTMCFRPPGDGQQGATCSTVADCAAGYACNSLDGVSSRCGKTVEYPSGTCSGNTLMCEYNPPLFIGGTEYGSCL